MTSVTDAAEPSIVVVMAGYDSGWVARLVLNCGDELVDQCDSAIAALWTNRDMSLTMRVGSDCDVISELVDGAVV